MKKKSDLKPFGDYLEIISHSHDRYKVFDDFLTIIVCTLSLGRKEELYKSTIKPYTKEEIEAAIEALGRGASIRGEALTLEEFAKLADLLSECRF